MREKPGPNGQDDIRPDAALSTVEEPTIVLESAEPVREAAEPPAPAGPEPPPTKRRRVPRWALAVAAGLLVAGALVAIVLLARRSPEPVTAPTESSLVVAAPIALQADAHAFRVVLRWIQASPAGVEGYDIYRNGVYLAKVEAPTTSFTDDEALPAQRYEYEVEAFSGATRSEPATVQVRTTKAPLAMARLEGAFDVRARTESTSGYDNYSDRQNFGWDFSPRCDQGACSTVWRDLNQGKIRAKLAKHGARYTGTFHGHFNVRCGGTDTDSDVTLDLRVAKARAAFGDWRVVKLVGTLKHTEPSQLGCVTSSATLSITARLVD